MTRLGTERRSPKPLANTLLIRPMVFCNQNRYFGYRTGCSYVVNHLTINQAHRCLTGDIARIDALEFTKFCLVCHIGIKLIRKPAVPKGSSSDESLCCITGDLSELAV